MNLNMYFKSYVDEHGIRQTHLAKMTGISQQAISAILNNARKIETSEFFALCKALSMNPTETYEKAVEGEKEKR